MQIKLFTIPTSANEAAIHELNAFLRGNKVLEIDQQLVKNKNGAYWCFCIKYLEQAFNRSIDKKREKVDYRKVLNEATFNKFAQLREIRKKVAAEEGISAYIVFTDAELAELAKMEEITTKAMLGIRGVGEKKVERFAHHFITKKETDETGG